MKPLRHWTLTAIALLAVVVIGACRDASLTDPPAHAAEPPQTAPATTTAVLAATTLPTLGPAPTSTATPPTRTGAAVLADQDFAPLHGRRVGVIAHRASLVDGERLIDLIAADPRVGIVALFAPEHGLSGTLAAGEAVDGGIDESTGVPVFGLYGESRSPDALVLAQLDVLVYDLQDVGTRFYTYTSTMGLTMKAAADAEIEFMVLDRPNPLGTAAIAGPQLQPGLESFVGMYPLPTVYGLTAGELATMIKTEALLPGLESLELTVVPMQHWSRSMAFAAARPGSTVSRSPQP